MGESNPVGVAVSFSGVLESKIDQLIAVTGRIDYATSELNPALLIKIANAYRNAGAVHRASLRPHGLWGFKNPRQIFMLPIIELVFPSARFVHLIRDGRDMVISNNKTQARKYFRTLFGSSYDESVEQTAHFWAKTNLEVYAYGTAKMGSRFAVVRIEDLCGPDREVHIAKLARAIGLDLDKAV
jgi:hypothetical protein